MSNFLNKIPVSPITSFGNPSVPNGSTIGTNFSVLQTGGFMEIYSLSGLTYTIPPATTGIIEFSGNSIPIQLTKGSGSVFSPDVLTLNSDNISSGRRKLGMLVYVYETNKIYQFKIDNYDTLWNNATGATGPGGSTVVISNFGSTVKNNSAAGIAFIDAWTSSTISGIDGYNDTNASWKVLSTGGSGGLFTGGTVSGATNFTGGLSATTISATTYENLPFSGTVNGSGVRNFITKFTPTETSIGDSVMANNSNNVTIGSITTPYRLYVLGVNATADQPLLAVRDNGRVGIRTTTPTAELSIVNSNSGTSQNIVTLRNNASGIGTGNALSFINSTNENSTVGSKIESVNTLTNGRNKLGFYVHGGGGAFGGLLERMWVDGTGTLSARTLSATTAFIENVTTSFKGFQFNYNDDKNYGVFGLDTGNYSRFSFRSEDTSEDEFGYLSINANPEDGVSTFISNNDGSSVYQSQINAGGFQSNAITNGGFGYIRNIVTKGETNEFSQLNQNYNYFNIKNNNYLSEGLFAISNDGRVFLGDFGYEGNTTFIVLDDTNERIDINVGDELNVNGNLRATTIKTNTISATTYQNLPFSGTVIGSGTTGYIPKFNTGNTIDDSIIFQSGSNVGINTTTATYRLNINSGNNWSGMGVGDFGLNRIMTLGYQNAINLFSPTSAGTSYWIRTTAAGPIILNSNTGVVGDLKVSNSINATTISATTYENLPAPDLSNYVPYTGATQDVNLGVNNLIATTISATTYQNLPIPTLQQVLDFNHDLVDGIFTAGTGAGSDNSGSNVNAIGTAAALNNSGSGINALGSAAGIFNSGNNVNAFGGGAGYGNQVDNVNMLGNSAGFNNTGENLNAMGSGASVNNTGNNVNAFGIGAGNSNVFDFVNLFGRTAEATADGQTVLSKDGTIMARINTSGLTASQKYNLPNQSGTFSLLNDLSNYVPYTGATQNVDLSTFSLSADNLTINVTKYNTTYSITGNEPQGAVYWNADRQTLQLKMNGTNYDYGMGLYFYIKNQSGVQINKGDVVGFAGTLGMSGIILGAKYVNDGSQPSDRLMGVAKENIPNGDEGKVVFFGEVRGINTNAYSAGTILYSSNVTAGALINTIPNAGTNKGEIAAVITQSSTVGTIFVRALINKNLEELNNVNISGATNGDVLIYDSNDNLWKNGTLKQATFTVELIDDITVDFYAPFDLKINTFNVITGSGTITIQVNDLAYTLETLIDQGDKITVTTTTASVVNLEVSYE